MTVVSTCLHPHTESYYKCWLLLPCCVAAGHASDVMACSASSSAGSLLLESYDGPRLLDSTGLRLPMLCVMWLLDLWYF